MYQGPKRTKYKKTKKGNLKKFEFKANTLHFGTIGLKAAESGAINSRQIEAARQALSRKIKKKGKIWIKIFPDLPITSKPKGTRMGKGKGAVSHWNAKVKCGSVLFEICGSNWNNVFKALKTCGAKLPIRTKVFK